MPPEQIKHLEFIQNVITRMNTNSFQLKGWMVTIVTAVLALAATTKNPFIILVGLIPITILWGLDAYYLWQERKFRGLYKNVVSGIARNPPTIELLSMDASSYFSEQNSYKNALISPKIAYLYGPIITFIALVFVVGLLCWLYCPTSPIGAAKASPTKTSTLLPVKDSKKACNALFSEAVKPKGLINGSRFSLATPPRS